MSVIDNALRQIWKDGIKLKKLWTNASPGSDFAGQNLTLPDNDADMLAITHESNADAPKDAANQTVIIGQVGTGGQVNVQATAILMSRGYTWGEQNKLSIGDAQRVPTYGNAASRTEVNNRLVPLAVYGIKLLGGGYRITRYIKSLFFRKERGRA